MKGVNKMIGPDHLYYYQWASVKSSMVDLEDNLSKEDYEAANACLNSMEEAIKDFKLAMFKEETKDFAEYVKMRIEKMDKEREEYEKTNQT